MFVRDRTLETYLFFTISIGCREEVYHTILPSEPFSFALRELVDNYINFSYLLKNPEDCQRMFDYLKYYGVYVRTQNSAVTLGLKKDFLLKYILSEKTKDQIQKGEKSIYSVVNKTRIDRWTLKSPIPSPIIRE